MSERPTITTRTVDALVKVDAVVVLTTGETATTRMFPVQRLRAEPGMREA
jgi:hypothetical protein